MAFSSGMSESFVLGFETSFKVPPATLNVEKEPVANISFKPATNWHFSEAKTGNPEPREPVLGKIGLDASFELECSKDSLPVPLKGLFGAPDTSGTTGFFDHYFTLKSTGPLSMFAEQQFTDISQYLYYNGLYLGKADFRIEPEGLMKATFGGMGAKMRRFSSSQVNGATTDRTGSSPVNYLPGVLKQGGAVIAYIQSASVSVDRQLDKRSHIDSTNEIGVIFSQIAKVTGSFKASFQDGAMLDLALAGTETSAEFQLWDSVTGHGVNITLPTIKIKPAGVTSNGTGLNDLDFEFEGYGRTGATATKAEVWSKFFTAEAGLNLLTLIFALTGSGAPADQTVTFETGDDTPTEIAAEINAETTDMTAAVENGRVVVRPDNAAHTIQVTAPSTADVLLGFDNAVHSSYSGKSIIVRVSNAQATVLA